MRLYIQEIDEAFRILNENHVDVPAEMFVLRGKAAVFLQKRKPERVKTEPKDALAAVEHFKNVNVESLKHDAEALKDYIKNFDSAIKEFGDKQADTKKLLELMKMLAEDYMENIPSKASSRTDRIATVDFGVVSEKLTHTYDLERLSNYVIRLFDWHTNRNIRKKFIAPYFSLVQSSGTGKTKLLWELRELINNDDNNDRFGEYECKTILCVDTIPKETLGDADSIFSTCLQVDPGEREETRRKIFAALNDMFQDCKKEKVVFLFDESQHLLQSDAFGFRCVRWWLRFIRPQPGKQVVAVFAGTSSRLANVPAEPPVSVSSRDPASDFHESGQSMYQPFFNLHTTGSIATKAGNDHGQNDFERAIPHGRPLFAVMHKDGGISQDHLSKILDRMLLSVRNRPWETSLMSCLSVLATRVQMGQTSTALLSDFVAKGYAWLTHYHDSLDDDTPSSQEGYPRMCFKTDPVPARLAMCLMDEDWSIAGEHRTFQGKDKRFWTSKICEIFSKGLCIPNQGNLEEIAGACYLLFCGDLIRKRLDPSYRTFSVPLDDYVACLTQHNLVDSSTVGNVQFKHRELRYTEAHVSFIHVVRNYMRFPLQELARLDILKDMYTAGVAFYSYPLCPAFDMVASIRLTKADNTFCYVPLLVSISTGKNSNESSENLKEMTKMLEDAGTAGMGIRLVFNDPHNKPNELLTKEDVGSLLEGQIVSKVLVVPGNDQFGIVQLLLDRVSDGPVTNEIDSSDYFLRTGKLQESFDLKQWLRKGAKTEERNYLESAVMKRSIKPESEK